MLTQSYFDRVSEKICASFANVEMSLSRRWCIWSGAQLEKGKSGHTDSRNLIESSL